MTDKIRKTEAEWRKQLTGEQFRITREKGTERAFTGEYNASTGDGMFHCICCGNPLFDSTDKFDSGSGWPSFTKPADPASVDSVSDNSHGMRRTEVLCSKCDAHLGHVFPDGPGPSGQRFCINSAALQKTEKQG